MAVAFVQKSTELFADNAASIAPSLSGVTAGNLVVMAVASLNNGSGTALAAPSGWSVARTPAGVGSGFFPIVAIFYKENSAGGTESGTVALPANSYAAASIAEFSGVKTSGALANANDGNGTGVTSGNTGSAANTVADAVAIVVGTATDDGSAPSDFSSPATTGYTAVDTEPSGAVHCPYDISYKILTVVASESGAWAWTGSGIDFCGAIAVFDGASVGGGQDTGTIESDIYL